MKFIVSENQMTNLISKVTKTDIDNSFLSKILNFFGGDDESVPRVVFNAIQDGKDTGYFLCL